MLLLLSERRVKKTEDPTLTYILHERPFKEFPRHTMMMMTTRRSSFYVFLYIQPKDAYLSTCTKAAAAGSYNLVFEWCTCEKWRFLRGDHPKL